MFFPFPPFILDIPDYFFIDPIDLSFFFLLSNHVLVNASTSEVGTFSPRAIALRKREEEITREWEERVAVRPGVIATPAIFFSFGLFFMFRVYRFGPLNPRESTWQSLPPSVFHTYIRPLFPFVYVYSIIRFLHISNRENLYFISL